MDDSLPVEKKKLEQENTNIRNEMKYLKQEYDKLRKENQELKDSIRDILSHAEYIKYVIDKTTTK